MADMARVEEILRKYPSLFVSLQAAGIDSELVSLQKLQDEDIEDINLNESRTQNVISYAYFVKGEKAKAYEQNDVVIGQHPSNVIALSNKAWFLLNDNKLYEADKVCLELERAEKVDVMVARGELAFAYSRFGPKTYALAVKEYEELLEECFRSRPPDKYFCMWSFALFLLLRRKHKASKMFTERDSSSKNRQLQILRDATKIYSRDETVKLYQGKCYANICKILYGQVSKQYTGKDRHTRLRQEPLRAMEKAFELGYNDVDTLDKIGKYMRYYPEKIHDTISCLKRSIELRGTSKGYHRLALAQKRELESKEFRKQPKHIPEPNRRIVNLKKCPRTPSVSLSTYKSDPLMKEVLKNLEMAVTLDPKNMTAFYDFGLTYRQIDEFEKALEKFENITRFHKGPRTCTMFRISNAYEQSGFCIADMCDAGKVPSAERIRLGHKLLSAFKKSVELSCSHVRTVPLLVQLWATTPTLSQLLTGAVRTSEEVIELMFLNERLMSQSNLDIIRKLSDIDGYLEHNDRRIHDLISQLVDAENYDDAILTMELITCLPNGYDALDDDTYTDIYIRGGLEAYMCGEALLGDQRILNALTFRKNKSQRAGGTLNEQLDEDIANFLGIEVILIYQNESLKDAADELLSVFKVIGIKITAYPPCKKIVCGADNTVMRNYIALVGESVSDPEDGANLVEPMENLAINNFDTNVDLIFKDLEGQTYGNLLIAKLEADTEVPDRLQVFSHRYFPR